MQVHYPTCQCISCTVIVWEFSAIGILLFVIPGMTDIKQSNRLNELRNKGYFITSEPHITVLISLRNNKSLSVSIAGETPVEITF